MVGDASTVVYFGRPLVFLFVGGGGELSLSDVIIEESWLTAKRNGSLRLINVTFSGNDWAPYFDIDIGSAVSLLGTFNLTEGVRDMQIALRNGSTGYFSGSGIKTSITLATGSSGYCNSCENNEITYLGLEGNSTFKASGTIFISSQLRLDFNSSFIQSTGYCKTPPYDIAVDATSVAEWRNCSE